MSNRYKISYPDGPGSSMHETVALCADMNEVKDELEQSSASTDISQWMVTDLDTGNTLYADWVLNGDCFDTGDEESIYSCNGCGASMTLKQIALKNNQGDDYCADCTEAINSDPESAAGTIEDEEVAHA